MKRLYNVKTWDIETGKFTPQEGLPMPSQGIPLSGVLAVLRELRANWSYSCDRSDPSVLVERIKPSWLKGPPRRIRG